MILIRTYLVQVISRRNLDAQSLILFFGLLDKAY